MVRCCDLDVAQPPVLSSINWVVSYQDTTTNCGSVLKVREARSRSNIMESIAMDTDSW
jgi:hypothetical protein